MPSDTPFDDIAQARAALAAAHDERARQVRDLDLRAQERSAARALAADELPGLEKDYQAQVASVARARTDLKTVRARLKATLLERLATNPEDDLAELDTDVPLALFPVRLESRFVRFDDGTSGELKVRIYPDQITSNVHEPLLTEHEREAAEAAWSTAWQEGDSAEAWRTLLRQLPLPRASWAIAQTRPTNVDAPGDVGQEPQFPDIELRPDGWSRHPTAKLLPDRWFVSAWRDGELRQRVISGPVEEELVLSLTISTDGDEETLRDDFPLSDDGLDIDEELRWAFEFERAEEAGMAVRLPLDRDDLARGFDRLLVVGARTSATADETAEDVAALWQNHRHSHGMAFLRQGTATNNSDEKPAEFPTADPGGSVSYAREWGPLSLSPDGDGHRFAMALGVDGDSVLRLERANTDEQGSARAMNRLLWPATIGYFVDQLLAPTVPRHASEKLRGFFEGYVRGRGPLPALRIGSVPYAVLPTAPMARWKASDTISEAEQWVGELVKRILPTWALAAREVPHAFAGSDADADLLSVLGQTASSQMALVRKTLGWEARWNMLTMLGLDPTPWENVRRALLRGVLASLGLEAHGEQPDPRILFLDYEEDASRFWGSMVAQVLSETDPLADPNYLEWLRTASLAQLRNVTPGLQRPYPLLYLMARHGLLAEVDAAASNELVLREMLQPSSLFEPEVLGVVQADEQPSLLQRVAAIVTSGAPAAAPVVSRSTAWQRLDTVVPDLAATATLGELILSNPVLDTGPQFPGVSQTMDAIAQLEGIPSAELDRLFTESLDLCSHRIDAWITALHTARLERLRTAHPEGLLAGGYGWLEDLRPDPPERRVPVMIPGVGMVDALTDSAGYLFAPSILHGATAAVLRSAYLSRTGPEQEVYAIDLSSARVRTAMWVLDEVREGQSLSAVLGYRFERGLHEGHPGVELDKFIDAFRARYPIRTPRQPDPSGPTETIAARNVVDGLRLHTAYEDGVIPWSHAEFQPSSDERAAIEDELGKLDGTLDAVADLLTAESVYQMLRGTPEGVAATLDTMAKGMRPPEPEVARLPRSGTAVNHRMALVLGGDAQPLPQWAAIPATPRAAAEPYLEAWFGTLLGDPGKVICAITPEGSPSETVRLSDLGIRALDILMIAQQLAEEAADSELDRRVLEAANRAAGSDRALTIDYTAAGAADEISFAVALELATSVLAVLGRARPLEPRDLVPPELDPTGADPMTAELDDRATGARTALTNAETAVQNALAPIQAAAPGSNPPLGALRQALYGASLCGIPAAYPRCHHGADDAARTALVDRAESVLEELRKRLAQAAAASGALDALQNSLGRALPILPRFRPHAPELLAPGIAIGPALGPEPQTTIEAFLRRMARVQPSQDDWRRILIFAGVLGRPVPEVKVAQLPHSTPAARWAALPFDDEADRPLAGLVSLVLHRVGTPAADEPWVGLLLDEWNERIPLPEEDGGVVFHYDAPAAEAPNALLLALPPESGAWGLDYLEATLNETLDLVRIRAVDRPGLGPLDHFAPMTYLAENPEQLTISTSFAGQLIAHAVIAAQPS